MGHIGLDLLTLSSSHFDDPFPTFNETACRVPIGPTAACLRSRFAGRSERTHVNSLIWARPGASPLKAIGDRNRLL
jgi:hypothetical protein